MMIKNTFHKNSKKKKKKKWNNEKIKGVSALPKKKEKKKTGGAGGLVMVTLWSRIWVWILILEDRVAQKLYWGGGME